MAQKLRDLAVRVSEYTDSQGQTKGRFVNVGSLMKSDDGNEFIIMNRTFNPAGVPNPDNRDSVLVSCFKPNNGQQNNQQGSQQRQQSPQQQNQQFQQPQNNGGWDSSDDIPFAAMSPIGY